MADIDIFQLAESAVDGIVALVNKYSAFTPVTTRDVEALQGLNAQLCAACNSFHLAMPDFSRSTGQPDIQWFGFAKVPYYRAWPNAGGSSNPLVRGALSMFLAPNLAWGQAMVELRTSVQFLRMQQPSRDSGDDYQHLTPAARNAYFSFQCAELAMGRRLTDREAYDWIKKNGIPDSCGSKELSDYNPPDFETWSRYLRIARQQLHLQKNTSRLGRTGRSIVNASMEKSG